jgi:DNA-binding NarL/FixJ family response regulator
MGHQDKLLNKREKQVLYLLSMGYTDVDIAEDLLLTSGTIKGYVHRLLNIIGVKNRTQLAIYAYQTGILSPFDIDLGMS